MADRSTVRMAVIEIARYAERLIGLIDGLPEEQLWSKAGGMPNSIGTLALHLTGNLNHYFGTGLLRNGYVRDRDGEFAETDLPKDQVIPELRAAVAVAQEALGAIDEGLLDQPYRSPCGEAYESLAYHIVRLATHFSLHVGQADYASNVHLSAQQYGG